MIRLIQNETGDYHKQINKCGTQIRSGAREFSSTITDDCQQPLGGGCKSQTPQIQSYRKTEGKNVRIRIYEYQINELFSVQKEKNLISIYQMRAQRNRKKSFRNQNQDQSNLILQQCHLIWILRIAWKKKQSNIKRNASFVQVFSIYIISVGNSNQITDLLNQKQSKKNEQKTDFIEYMPSKLFYIQNQERYVKSKIRKKILKKSKLQISLKLEVQTLLFSSSEYILLSSRRN